MALDDKKLHIAYIKPADICSKNIFIDELLLGEVLCISIDNKVHTYLFSEGTFKHLIDGKQSDTFNPLHIDINIIAGLGIIKYIPIKNILDSHSLLCRIYYTNFSIDYQIITKVENTLDGIFLINDRGNYLNESNIEKIEVISNDVLDSLKIEYEY